VGEQRHALAALPPGKSTVTHFTGGWECPRTGLDGNGTSPSNRVSIPGPSRPYQIAITTALSRPTGGVRTQSKLESTKCS